MTNSPPLTTIVPVGTVVKNNIKQYGHYVMEERAVASLLDGLKPVQRKLLWSIWNRLGGRPEGQSKKSARVVGETTGCFHPHAPESAYQSLANMVWDNYPLIEGVGNLDRKSVV